MIHNHGLKRAAAAQVGFLYIAPYNSRPVAVNFTITVKAGDRYQGELTPTRDLGETLNHRAHAGRAREGAGMAVRRHASRRVLNCGSLPGCRLFNTRGGYIG